MLIVFLFAETPFANAGIYLATSLSNEHEVRAQNDGGKVAIVLHHRGLAGQHSSVTKALLFLTNVTEDSQHDHVLGCAVASNLSVQITAKFPDPKRSSLVNALILSEEPISFRIGTFTKTLTIARPPPPEEIAGSTSTLEYLKTIVLLV
jgi:hypothetical protein